MMLRGKTALVTGASRGIGAEIARVFSEQGAIVLLGDLRREEAEQTAATIASATGGICTGLPLDITDPGQIGGALAEIRAAHGRLDILINNAGVLRRAKTLEMTLDNWERTLRTNATGTFLMVQAAGRLMRDQGGGNIVSIASCSGKKPCSGEIAYGASKLAVIGITQVAALELGVYGIRCNALCPGSTDSRMLREQVLQTEEDLRRYLEGTALRRLGTPRDQANVALFLASDLSAHMTGAVVVASGGEYFSL